MHFAAGKASVCRKTHFSAQRFEINFHIGKSFEWGVNPCNGYVSFLLTIEVFSLMVRLFLLTVGGNCRRQRLNRISGQMGAVS